MEITFDVETNTKHKGNPFTKGAKVVSWGACEGDERPAFYYYKDADFVSKLREFFGKATLLIGVNIKFDLHHAQNNGITVPEKCRVWDCQLAEFILSGQTVSFASMDQLCEKYGIVGKEGGLHEYWDKGIDTEDIPRDVVESYNVGDISRTRGIYKCQLTDPRMMRALHKLILLCGADLLVLQQMEYNGFKYDRPASIETGVDTRQELDQIKDRLDSLVDCSHFNWNSGDHLSSFLYGGYFDIDIFVPFNGIYKSGPRKGQEYTQNRFQETKRYSYPGIFKPVRRSEVAKSTAERPLYQVSEPILKQLRASTKHQKQVIEWLLRQAELSKLCDTYYFALPKLLEDMEWGDMIHGQYNQVIARTGRLSSSKPNTQNIPPEVDKLFISRYD